MNRYAVVLAADSASTVTRWVDGKVETRYFKGSNKIFQLSHFQPVGLMIFNSAELLRVPWDILIKSFRDHLGDKKYDQLDGYADEFFSFLDGNLRFFPEEAQREEFYSAAERAVGQLVFSVVDDLSKLQEKAARVKLEQAAKTRMERLNGVALCARIKAEHLAQSVAAQADIVAERIGHWLDIPNELKAALARFGINDVFKRPGSLFPTAGLVFAGFGDHDIFPRMIEYQSSGMLDGVQVIEEKSREAVDHEVPATLNAFAQTSMADTFSLGFSFDVYTALMDSLRGKLNEFASAICASLNADIKTLENLNEMVGTASAGIADGWFERARKEHSYPLKSVLGALPVDEMAELAETLVNLQALKEKVTKPSASVGGPVDVAIITRHEGLVWTKRKMFFDATKNPRYLYRQQAVYTT